MITQVCTVHESVFCMFIYYFSVMYVAFHCTLCMMLLHFTVTNQFNNSNMI